MVLSIGFRPLQRFGKLLNGELQFIQSLTYVGERRLAQHAQDLGAAKSEKLRAPLAETMDSRRA